MTNHLAVLVVHAHNRASSHERGIYMSQVVVANDLTVVIGNEAVRLTPSQGFELAERLIRRSTARIVVETIAASKPAPAARAARARAKVIDDR